MIRETQQDVLITPHITDVHDVPGGRGAVLLRQTGLEPCASQEIRLRNSCVLDVALIEAEQAAECDLAGTMNRV